MMGFLARCRPADCRVRCGDVLGLRWQAMVQGLAPSWSHQLGSFLGAYGGGVLYDALGSYDLAWRLGVGLGTHRGRRADYLGAGGARVSPLHQARLRTLGAR